MKKSKEKFVPQKISRQNKKKEKNELLSWVLSLFIAVAIAVSLRVFVFDFVIVEGDSMNPTLISGEIMFVEKVSYRFNEPQKGDIIVTKYNTKGGENIAFDNGQKNYVKRVIANSSDSIKIESGMVYVNDNQLIEPYIKEDMIGNMPEVTVEDHHVFVMGDNRNNSMDSRFVGALDLDLVRGRAIFRVLPFKEMGKIN